MKWLQINSPEYQLIQLSFTEWLEYQNYSKSTVNNYSSRIRELLYYLETKGVNRLLLIEPYHITDFIESVKNRPNETNGGGLNNRTVNHIIQSVNKFLGYLKLTKGLSIEVELKTEKVQQKKIDILTKEEIEHLFELTEGFHPVNKRSKAILSVLYGAGLRRSEIENLKLDDVSFQKKQLHIKHAKGNKDRIVPVPDSVIEAIQTYINECRDIFEDASEKPEDNLFIEITGKKMSESAYDTWLKRLLEHFPTEKHITLHTFRHSIATHLLKAGMDIEDIARFLGHNSLDSTMIYTHYV